MTNSVCNIQMLFVVSVLLQAYLTSKVLQSVAFVHRI
jgi:hypothetical protein